MTYIALPDISGLTGDGGYQLVRVGDNAPVALLFPKKDMPVPMSRFAENIASLFNGHNPLHRFGEAHTMSYQAIPGGIEFRFRDKGKEPGEANVSRVGVSMTMTQGFEDLLEQAMSGARTVFNMVMSAGCETERRTEPRVAADTKAATPKPAPRRPSGPSF